MNINQYNTKNYLIPSSGETHAVNINGIFSAVPFFVDWRQFSIDNFPFIAQGVFVDNTNGTSNLIINFQPINYNLVCPAGTVGQYQFPSVDNQTCTITGNGAASLVFVDFPVLPNAGVTEIGNTVNVDVVSPNPLPVSVGQILSVQKTPFIGTYFYGSITGVAKSVSIATTGNIRRIIIALSQNGGLAAAASNMLLISVNGSNIYEENIYMQTTNNNYYRELNFSEVVFNSGTGLTVSLVSALATGILDINVYCD